MAKDENPEDVSKEQGDTKEQVENEEKDLNELENGDEPDDYNQDEKVCFMN